VHRLGEPPVLLYLDAVARDLGWPIQPQHFATVASSKELSSLIVECRLIYLIVGGLRAVARGGRRPGAGRPMGAKDRIRGGRRVKLGPQLEGAIEDVETAEFLVSNANKTFDGSALELIREIYKCEKLPVKIRLYAATKAVEYEGGTIGEDRDFSANVVVYLPDNTRDWSPEERIGNEGVLKQRDKELKQWIGEGKLTEEQAIMVRKQWARDIPWEPMGEPGPSLARSNGVGPSLLVR